MFQMHLFFHEHNEEEHVVNAIAIQCINCHRKNGLHIMVYFIKYVKRG